MSFSQQYTLASDSTFIGQVTVAMEQTAVYCLLSEAVTAAGHQMRCAFAVQTLQNPTHWAPIIAVLIASQGSNPMTPLTTPSTVSDGLIATAMGAEWSALAGYFTVNTQ